MSQSKCREFWIKPGFIGQETGIKYPSTVLTEYTPYAEYGFIHVVEKSALDEALDVIHYYSMANAVDRNGDTAFSYDNGDQARAFLKKIGEVK